LNQSSFDSLLVALTGVIGEAIDFEVNGSLFFLWSRGESIVFGEGTKVDNEERDSECDEIEPC
jgi:hypothetical protein